MQDDPKKRGNIDITADIREVIRQRYAGFAQAGSSCCAPSGDTQASGCGCGSAASLGGPSLADLGYTPEQAAAIPQGANLGLGCGNPLGYAAVQPGETVLDLGSGAGIDAFLASREVGPTGHVIGVDMTAAMLGRARANAAREGYTNVEFRLGEIENLPVAESSVDVIISNCVVNLSPHKDRVFREALRVLKPGGRMLLSDLVWRTPPAAEIRKSIDALIGCVAGASLKDEYLDLIRQAGFQEVEVLAESSYGSEALKGCCGEGLDGLVAADAVASVKVRAVKPR
jgi:arsenite methyltransferase